MLFNAVLNGIPLHSYMVSAKNILVLLFGTNCENECFLNDVI